VLGRRRLEPPHRVCRRREAGTERLSRLGGGRGRRRRASLGRAGGQGAWNRARGRVDFRSILVRRVGRLGPSFWLPASERQRGCDRDAVAPRQ
jgi:hypothetical protein